MKNEKKRVVMQGFRGSYHEIAARRYFGPEIEIVSSLTFNDLFSMLASDRSLSGIVAIENTVAGSILPNYELIRESGYFVSGEVKLRINLNLLACPGQKMDDILEVMSHPLALVQCREFFREYPSIRLTESADTALSAKEISETGLKGAGVVASKLAAELYGLEVLSEGIESNKRNYTRFLILEPDENPGGRKHALSGRITKASIAFKLPNRKGTLVSVLSVFANNGCNLTAIQSNPIPGRAWEYLFYTDLVFKSYRGFSRAVEQALPLCNELRVIGEYPEGEVFNN
jgi:prephenate dehydratase